MNSTAPLKGVHFHILLVLLAGPRHGYGIVKDIESVTRGALRLEPGNLYRYVGQLQRAGLVTRDLDRVTAEAGDERRRYYRIAEKGRKAVAAEVERMRGLVASAEDRLKVHERGLPEAP